MDNPAERGTQGTTILIGIAASLGAMVVACTVWALLGYYVASTLRFGLILLPIASGCSAGIVMRIGGRCFGQRTGWVAVAVTLIGCLVGDLFWIAMFNHKPFSQLLGAELVATMNTVFDPIKMLWYAVACYLAYAISNPPRVFVPD